MLQLSCTYDLRDTGTVVLISNGNVHHEEPSDYTTI